jgi:pyrroloquinoline quinone (PQQ) biosynthesis protein C
MAEMYWKVAETKRQVDEAQRVRWTCIRDELGIVARGQSGLRRDVSVLDGLPNVHHILVYHGREAVGTARLMQANADVARADGSHYGFEIEAHVDLRRLGLRRSELGEVSGLCVLSSHAPRAAARLYEGLYAQSRSLGLEYWIGGVDSGTDDAEGAARLYRELERCGLVSTDWHIRAERIIRSDGAEPRASDCHAAGGDLGTLPHALGAFVRRLNARAIGAPVSHPRFRRHVVPMLAVLDAIPDSTLALFDTSARMASGMPREIWERLLQVSYESLRRLDEHPVGRALIDGTIAKVQYVAYLTQVVHQVRHSAPMLARAAERLEQLGRQRLAQTFRRKAGEEDGHDDWALRDLAALGVTREAALSTPCGSAVRAYGAWLAYCAECNPTAVLGLAFTLEWFGCVRAGRAADNLVRRAPIQGIESAVRFLRGHGAADDEHIRAFAEPLSEITDPDEMEAILLSARLTSDLYLGMLASAGAAGSGGGDERPHPTLAARAGAAARTSSMRMSGRV